MIMNLFQLSFNVGFNRKASVFKVRELELGYCKFTKDGDDVLLILFITEKRESSLH